MIIDTVDGPDAKMRLLNLCLVVEEFVSIPFRLIIEQNLSNSVFLKFNLDKLHEFLRIYMTFVVSIFCLCHYRPIECFSGSWCYWTRTRSFVTRTRTPLDSDSTRLSWTRSRLRWTRLHHWCLSNILLFESYQVVLSGIVCQLSMYCIIDLSVLTIAKSEGKQIPTFDSRPSTASTCM
jgi:hypothetical protein